MENPKVSGAAKNLLVTPISQLKKQLKSMQEDVLNKPDDVENYIKVMKMAMKLDDANKVECYGHRALKIDPENKDVLNLLGVVYYKQHKSDDAITTFNRLLEVDPKNVKALVNMGLVYMVVRCDPTKAVEQFKAALKLEKDNETALVGLGQAYLKINDYDAALEAFTQAFKANDKCDKATVGIADAHLGNKNYESAIDYYERRLVVDDRCPFALYGLFHVYECMEDEDKQKDIVSRARAIDTF